MSAHRHSLSPRLLGALSTTCVWVLAGCNLAPQYSAPPLSVPTEIVPANAASARDHAANPAAPAAVPALPLADWVTDDRLLRLLQQALGLGHVE